MGSVRLDGDTETLEAVDVPGQHRFVEDVHRSPDDADPDEHPVDSEETDHPREENYDSGNSQNAYWWTRKCV